MNNHNQLIPEIPLRTACASSDDESHWEEKEMYEVKEGDVMNIPPCAVHLGEAIRIKTISNPDYSISDFEEYEEFLSFLKKTYPKVHEVCQVDRVNRYSMIYHWKCEASEGKPILLTAHYDVVPVENSSLDSWVQGPFSGEIKDGYIYGRGALDDKNQVISIMEALEERIGCGLKPRRDVYVAFGFDEEVGVLIGTAMTVVVQSSSATIAVLQNLASQPGPDGVSSIIGLQGALPILFGDNIGTTITALLASIGASTNAKRTALSHTIFNMAGTLVFIFLIPQYARFIHFVSPNGAEIEVISREIANAHMFFNIFNTLLWLPFIWVLVKIVTKLIPGKEKELAPNAPMFLDYKIIESPVFALHLATKELSRIANITLEMIINAKKAFLGEDLAAAEKVLEMEDVVDSLQAETVKYLASIYTSDTLTESQATQISDMIHVAADIEHIGDHCTNIAEFAKEKIKNKYEFSDSASAEIYECFDSIRRMTTDTIRSLEDGDTELAKDVLEQEVQINATEDRLRIQHMKRLSEGKCSPQFTVMYIDIIHNIEKIGDYCTNIAEAVIKDIGFHRYKNIKQDNK